MTASYEHLMGYAVPESEQTLSENDCILYALSVGVGADPLDRKALPYVYEPNLSVLPTQACVLATPGFWLKAPDTGVDWRKVLHAEQRLTLHTALPVGRKVIGKTMVDGINDRGEGRGAFMYSRREVFEADSGKQVCTLEQTTMVRGDGGCGGSDSAPYEPHSTPERPPDTVCELPIAPNAALIYRLNGDPNPLHADPEIARAAGFDRPILHGLCTFAIAGHAVLATCCDYDARRIRSMAVRFTAPVYPGETLRTEMWRDDGNDGNVVSFRSLVAERDIAVLGNGYVELTDG